MSFIVRRLAVAMILLAATGCSTLAQKKYDTGATDTKIKIGNIMPYSGPASAFAVIGRTEAAYFRKINAEGGIRACLSPVGDTGSKSAPDCRNPKGPP